MISLEFTGVATRGQGDEPSPPYDQARGKGPGMLARVPRWRRPWCQERGFRILWPVMFSFLMAGLQAIRFARYPAGTERPSELLMSDGVEDPALEHEATAHSQARLVSAPNHQPGAAFTVKSCWRCNFLLPIMCHFNINRIQTMT